MAEVTRLLRLRHVIDRTGLSRSTIYELMATGRMPRPIAISDRATGWIEQEIEAFLQARIAAARLDAAPTGCAK